MEPGQIALALGMTVAEVLAIKTRAEWAFKQAAHGAGERGPLDLVDA